VDWEESRALAVDLTTGDHSPASGVTSAYLLKQSLDRLVDDDTFWTRLAGATAGRADRETIALLLPLDWQSVLTDVGYQGPVPAKLVAAQITDSLAAAMSERDFEAAGGLRELLRGLLRNLRDMLAVDEGQRDSKWRGRLRDLVGAGSRTLERLHVIDRLLDSAGEAAAVLAAAAIPALPIGVLVGAVVKVVVDQAASELRKALDYVQAAEPSSAVSTLDLILDQLAGC
jgi:hypothetical protein